MKPSMNRDSLPPEEPEDPFWEEMEIAFPHLAGPKWAGEVGSRPWRKKWRELFQWCRDYGFGEGEDAVITAQAEEEVARQLKRDGDMAEQYEKHLERLHKHCCRNEV